MKMYFTFFILIVALNLQISEFKPFVLTNYRMTYTNKQDKVGNYQFQYNTRFTSPTGDVGRTETGKVGKTDSGESVLRVNGSYHYGVRCDHSIRVYYSADENGFKSKLVHHFNRKYERINGTLVFVAAWCAAVPIAPIGNACIASLQGGCVGK